MSTENANAQRDLDLSNLSFEAFALSDVEPLPTPLPVNSSSSAIDSSTDANQSSNQSNFQSIGQYQLAIDELQNEEGPFAADLTEHLLSQAKLYEELNDHTNAIDKLDEALHITRINNGLFVLEQIELVEGLIENYTALGNFEEVDKYHGYLFYLHQRNFSNDEPEMVAATLDWAQWNIDAYLKVGKAYNPRTYGAGGLLPDDGVGDYVGVLERGAAYEEYYFIPRDIFYTTGAQSNNYELSPRSMAVPINKVINPRLREAQHQFESLEELSATLEANNFDLFNPQQLQLKLADAVFQIKNQIAYMETGPGLRRFSSENIASYSPNLLVRNGDVRIKKALEQIITNLQNNPNTPVLEIAEAILNLADWRLAFEHPQQAFTLYQEAYEQLSAANLSDSAINSFLIPKALVMVPSYATHPYTNEDWAASTIPPTNFLGYLDVEFKYNRGKTRAVRIIDSTESTPAPIRKILLYQLRTQLFRPRIINGQIESSTDYSLRFYYTY